MKTFIIAYDVFNASRLRKVAKEVYKYSIGGQKSCIEAPMNKKEIICLIKDISKLIEKKDRINIIKVLNKPILLGKASHLECKNNGVIIV